MTGTDKLRDRAQINRRIRDFFEARDFLEVETQHFVPAPGTDVHLAPFETRFDDGGRAVSGFLHTSPEFAMKELLVNGCARIYQLCKVWRNGELTDLHNPEFTLLEWYRRDVGYEVIIEDVEALVRDLLPPQLEIRVRGYEGAADLALPFARITMQELVERACGFDLLDALDAESLHQACVTAGCPVRRRPHWDEMFFELMIAHVEPVLRTLGAVFVTEWPAPLAVLAQKKPADPRVAERFELYVGGIELANGFQELTDPDEQRARFEQDNRMRVELGQKPLPMPERFLSALERGMPRAAGVAVGVDRLLMLATRSRTIADVLPFGMASWD